MLNFLLAFIIFISSFLRLFSPQPTQPTRPTPEISNWQTYKDSTYGFEFKYPPSSQPQILILTPADDDYYIDRSVEVFRSVGKHVSVVDVATKNPALEGKIIEYESIGVINKHAYIISPDGTIIKMSVTKSFDRILSTFKFLEKPSFNLYDKVTLQGEVLENIDETYFDSGEHGGNLGTKYLTIITDNGYKYKVTYYDVVKFSSCDSSSEIYTEKITPGSRVEISGEYESTDGEIYTCNSENYYIKIINP